MSRSLKKGPHIDPKLIKKVKALKKGDETPIKTWSRSAVISPEMVGFVFDVHTGKDFKRVKTGEDMVGHKLGEFAPTKIWRGHGGKKARDEAAAASAAEKTVESKAEEKPEEKKK